MSYLEEKELVRKNKDLEESIKNLKHPELEPSNIKKIDRCLCETFSDVEVVIEYAEFVSNMTINLQIPSEKIIERRIALYVSSKLLLVDKRINKLSLTEKGKIEFLKKFLREETEANLELIRVNQELLKDLHRE